MVLEIEDNILFEETIFLSLYLSFTLYLVAISSDLSFIFLYLMHAHTCNVSLIIVNKRIHSSKMRILGRVDFSPIMDNGVYPLAVQRFQGIKINFGFTSCHLLFYTLSSPTTFCLCNVSFVYCIFSF